MSRAALLAGLAFSTMGAILGSTPAWAQAEKDKFDKVKFYTKDQVEIHGLFYPSAKGKDAACVLLLNKLNDGKKENWDKLALALQAKGYAVLSFDFRGHGDSVNVDAEFWKFNHNLNGVRGYQASDPKKVISHRDFANNNYYLWLVNDIAAAKLFLDRRNDAGQCNSANVILIGEEDGAALGAMWLASEVNRYRAISLLPEKLETVSEGKNVVACVWLSMNRQIPAGKGLNANLTTWLKEERKIPMAFLFAEKDAGAKSLADASVRLLKEVKHPEENTAARMIKGAEKLAGSKMLKDSLETEKLIVDYLTNVVSKKSLNDYDKQDVEQNAYVWKFNAVHRIAKQPKEKILNFLPLDLLTR